MKKIKSMSFVLALLMVFTVFAGCSKIETNNDGKIEAGEVNKTENDETNDDNNIENNNEEEPKDKLEVGLTAEKIGSIEKLSGEIVDPTGSGFVYQSENRKYYGVLSVDGKSDTGAKYVKCKKLGNYFKVSTTEENTIDDVDSVNRFGIIDAKGEEIIPLKYATIEMLNDRYIEVCEVTEQTENKDEALVFCSFGMSVPLAPDGDDILFKGNWYIYDVVTGKKLEGVSGTKGYRILAEGNLVQYVTDDGETIVVNEKGEKIPKGAKLLGNGYYAIEEELWGEVYNSNHKKIFDYNCENFRPYGTEGDYFLSRKYDNNITKYALMDTTGKVISAEFSDIPRVYGDIIHVEEQVYSFDGKNIVEGTFEKIYFDAFTESAWILKNEANYTLINKDGTVLYKGTEDEVISFHQSAFCLFKKIDGKSMYYSLSDKDFTLEAEGAYAPWIVKVSGNEHCYDLADAISGKTIISGYDAYNSVTVPGEAIYVYAEKADGGYDIYTVK